jgi:hypothetical protein
MAAGVAIAGGRCLPTAGEAAAYVAADAAGRSGPGFLLQTWSVSPSGDAVELQWSTPNGQVMQPVPLPDCQYLSSLDAAQLAAVVLVGLSVVVSLRRLREVL